MNPIQNFWHEFEKVNLAVHLLGDLPKEVAIKKLQVVTEALNEYNEKLGFEIRSLKNKSELIITAHGNPYLFKEVELLVFHAPVLERWKITAFIQPDTDIDIFESKKDKPITYNGITLRVSDMYFIPYEIPQRPTDFGIKVLIKNYLVYKDNPALREAVYLHIENLVGEKSFANNITFIEIGQLNLDNQKDEEEPLDLYNLKFYMNYIGLE